MKLPGSKLLHSVDLAPDQARLGDVLRSCQQVGLTGFAEVSIEDALGMVFYYRGGEVNALMREGSIAINGQAALDRLIERASDNEGSVAIYELPLDMAHLLRGLSQRHKLNEEVGDAAAFEKLVERMAQSEHTGLLEIHTVSGAALLLMIAGRISNIYWETKEGVTFEKGEARHRLDRALAYGAEEVIISDFSRDMWRNRQTTPARLDARFIGPAPHGDTSQQVAVDRAVRQSVLDELHTEVPALLQAVFFDLMTGLILARKLRGTGAVRVGILSEKIPALTASVRDLVRLEGNDQLEFIHVTTGHVVIVVAVIVETQEGIAALADKSQPTALIEAALARASRSYLTRALKIKNTG